MFCCCKGKKFKSKKRSAYEQLEEETAIVVAPVVEPVSRDTSKEYINTTPTKEVKRDVLRLLNHNQLNTQVDYGAATSETVSDQKTLNKCEYKVPPVSSSCDIKVSRGTSDIRENTNFNFNVSLESRDVNRFQNELSSADKESLILNSCNSKVSGNFSNNVENKDLSCCSSETRCSKNETNKDLGNTTKSLNSKDERNRTYSDAPESDILINIQEDISSASSESILLINASSVLGAPSESTYLNRRDGNHVKQNSTIAVTSSQKGPQCIDIDLCILAKTAMHSKFCYLGFDRKIKRIYRPIYRTLEEQCCWDTDLKVNRTYTFKALHFPNNDSPPVTMLPHTNDDLIVEHKVDLKHAKNKVKKVFNELRSIAKSSLEEIFNGMSKQRYVEEMEDSPSVGVLKCHGAQIKVFLFNDKIRIRIGPYNLPYTGLDERNHKTQPCVDVRQSALVILGLARPWKGQNFEYSPRRCGILVLRIMQPTW